MFKQFISSIRKLTKKEWLSILVVVLMLGFIVGITLWSTPENAIKSTLQNSYSITVSDDIAIEKTGYHTYRVINPPVDLKTGAKFENWTIDSLGNFGILLAAECIDVTVPKITNVNITITENDYKKLMQFSENSGKDIDVIISEYINKLPA